MSAKTKKSKNPAEIAVVDAVDENPVESSEIVASVGVPPCPPSDPNLGMKTPAVVAWWFKHHPEQAKARYGGLTYPA